MRVMSKSLETFAQSKLDSLEQRGLRRRLTVSDRTDDIHVEREGRQLISFCCNDYLNLSHDSRVKQAAQQATQQLGAGSGASRLITGNHHYLMQVEEKLAAMKGTQSACLFGSGYLANIGIIPALVGQGDLILVDELAHACLMSGARLSQASEIRFPHNDMTALANALEQHRANHQRCLILTDGVFSMDGDLAPLPQMAELAHEHDAWLMTDDAHGLGVVGDGHGSAAHFGLSADDVPLQMGTLSKAVGGYGGYICASEAVVELIRNRGRSFVYSTGLPPASAAAALAALDIIVRNKDLISKPVANAKHFCRALNLPEPVSPIVPVILHQEARAMAAMETLMKHGLLVTAIRPPTVPENTARLRFTFTAQHRIDDIDRLVSVMRDEILKD